MRKRAIPADDTKVAHTSISDDEWRQIRTSHDRFKALLETKPSAKARYDAVLADITSRQAPLRRLREARSLTQERIAGLLAMDQSEVSRLEHRTDMLVSTLKRYVESTGGEMHIIVSYPDGGPVELVLPIEE